MGNHTHQEVTYVLQTQHVQSRGSDGKDGKSGTRPRNALVKGKNGQNGEMHVDILRDGQSLKVYNDRYSLKVKGFDVTDENGDGINEPGEWLYVKNIEIQNTGNLLPCRRRSSEI
jgi:hypothetical protein